MADLFDIVLADPPWHYELYGKRSEKGDRTADVYYNTVTSAQMGTDWNIPAIMAKDSILFLWVTAPMNEEAFELMRSYGGFTYGTLSFVWVKSNKLVKKKGFLELDDPDNWHIGLGHSTRGNVELVYSFKRGNGIRVERHDIPQLVIAPLGAEHSQKPDEVQRRIDALHGCDEKGLKRCELFARRQYRNWTCVGNQMPENPMLVEDFIQQVTKG